MAAQTLKEVLKTFTSEGELCEKLEGDRVRCYACGHRCVILPGLDGICRVRYNEGGRLMVPSGYVGAIQCDPTEKKPFFHAYPGSRALTFGMLGCDYHCSYCQNWVTSQALRDKSEAPEYRRIAASALHAMAPDTLQRHAREIALDPSESDEIRATSLTASSQFGGASAAAADSDFIKGVDQLRGASSADVKEAASRLLAKYGRE